MKAAYHYSDKIPREFSHPRNNHFAQNCRVCSLAPIRRNWAIATLLLTVLSFQFSILHAQPQNMRNHLWYPVYGDHDDAEYGGLGLNYIGKISDSIPNAVTIGQQVVIDTINGNLIVKPVAGLVYNNFQYDTSSHYIFNGCNVLPANINGDSYKDYVVWDNDANVYVLLGTPKIDSFIVAFSHYFGSANNEAVDVLPYDYDSSGHDGLIVSLPYQHQIAFYHGGIAMDTVPEYVIDAIAQHIKIGNVRDTSRMFLATYITGLYSDTTIIVLYQFQKGNFPKTPGDSIIFNTSEGGAGLGQYSGGGFAMIDVWDRGIEDFLLSAGTTVLVYKGGLTINGQHPDFRFDDPFYGGASSYGTDIIPIGNYTGWGNPSILITDPSGSYDGGYNNGGVFLFNIGKGLSDTCKGYFDDPGNTDEYLGETAICAGDILNEGHTDIMVGSQSDDLNNLLIVGTGSLNVLFGDPSYGYPVSDVDESLSVPVIFDLAQNYPNPFSTSSHIDFSVLEPKLYGKELTLSLSDILGKEIMPLYRGIADGEQHSVTCEWRGIAARRIFL